ncbi:MAG TPA: GAF domain-containing protein [Chthoniobacterales bacterium]|jgi:GAF domain-containing protein
MITNRDSNANVLPQLKQAFDKGGPRDALIFLNSLTNHRFTSLYRFDDEMLRNVVFYDSEHPDLEQCDDIPVLASYCVFVRDSGATFMTLDTQCDERVSHHPKRNSVQSYCGVPLLDVDGKMFGTICHFDFKPGRIENLDVELLEYMAELFRSKGEPLA